jgi:hypothetical protein
MLSALRSIVVSEFSARGAPRSLTVKNASRQPIISLSFCSQTIFKIIFPFLFGRAPPMSKQITNHPFKKPILRQLWRDEAQKSHKAQFKGVEINVDNSRDPRPYFFLFLSLIWS